MPLPNWLSGGFKAASNAASSVYGAADRFVGGVLPGGADSPYLGQSVNRKKQEKAKEYLNQFVGTNLISAGLEKAGPTALKVVDKLREETQVPYEKIKQAHQFVQEKLPWDLHIGPTFPGNENFNRDTKTVSLARDIVDSVFDPQTNVLERKFTTSGPIALHEFGHALNYGDRVSMAQANRNKFYGMRLQPGNVGGLSSVRGASDEDRNLIAAGAEGALAEIFSPGARHTLTEEGLASARAIKLAHDLGLPQGKRLLGSAFTTYVAPRLSSGFAEGVIGELGSKAAKHLANYITDNITDPIMDRVRGNDYTPLEESLLKYGYDEKKHRLTMPAGSDNAEVQFK